MNIAVIINTMINCDDNLKADRDFYFDNSRYDTRDKFVRKDLGKEKNDLIDHQTHGEK